MDTQLFEDLQRDGLISERSLEEVRSKEANKHISVRWELTTLLSSGILLFCSGIGIFVYKNIDSIGHITIVCLIAGLMIAGFVYCGRNVAEYSREKMSSVDLMHDYIVLGSSLLLVTFIGYTQFIFHLFGNYTGLAALTSAIALFFIAYRFDHLGVLSLAITNLAAWAGIAVAPMELMSRNDFGNDSIVYIGVLLGVSLLGLSALSMHENIKAHFAFTYKNFGIHLFFIAILAAMFRTDSMYLLWFLLQAAVAAYLWWQSLQLRSFYFLLVTILYTYIGLSSVIVRVIFNVISETAFNLGFLYIIGSSVMLIRLIIMYNRQLHEK